MDRTYNSHRSPYGAVDMVGNTWEWVADWFSGDYYVDAPNRNPKGPSSGDRRVVRGGSWGSLDSTRFRTADRNWFHPDDANSFVGFRCAKAP